ncbi:MAG: alpha/beta fold hydrolase [Nocardioidaceae bacterium]
MSDIVLVHGTTQSAAGFGRLVDLLEPAGHRTICFDVPSAAATTAAGYADLLAPQAPDDLHQPIVVAHSAAGLLLPALARRLDARHQVWLAAAVPDYRGHRSLLEEIQAEPTAVFQPEWIGLDPTTDPVLAT